MKKQALASELLNTPESCLPWEPIPARFSGAWQVDVTHVTEDYGEDRPLGENLTIALAAYLPPTETTPGDSGAWRLDFTACQAYRKRIIDYEGSAPLTRADPHSAFWEITGSHYLIESGVWATCFPHAHEYHHYVMVCEIHTVYEVLARGWRCTPLPPEWAKTFNAPMPKWPPSEA